MTPESRYEKIVDAKTLHYFATKVVEQNLDRIDASRLISFMVSGNKPYTVGTFCDVADQLDDAIDSMSRIKRLSRLAGKAKLQNKDKERV